MKVKVKLYDPSIRNRDYKFTAQVFEQFKQYMKSIDRNRIVYDGNRALDGELVHPTLEDAVGRLDSIEWVDSCAFGNVELLNTPKGMIYQDVLKQVADGASLSPVWSYRKVGDKILDLELQEIVILPTKFLDNDDSSKNTTVDDSGSRD